MGHDLDAGPPLQEVVDEQLQRIVERVERERMASCVRVREQTMQQFRAGLCGSTIPDMLRIHELEKLLAFKESVIESQQLAFDRLSWLAQQQGE